MNVCLPCIPPTLKSLKEIQSLYKAWRQIHPLNQILWKKSYHGLLLLETSIKSRPHSKKSTLLVNFFQCTCAWAIACPRQHTPVWPTGHTLAAPRQLRWQGANSHKHPEIRRLLPPFIIWFIRSDFRKFLPNGLIFLLFVYRDTSLELKFSRKSLLDRQTEASCTFLWNRMII